MQQLHYHLHLHYHLLKHYYKNPEKLKNDYRKKVKLDFETDESNDHDYEMAEEILKIIKPHFEGALKELDENLKEGINENNFVEGKMLDKKEAKGVVGKSKDTDVLDKKAKKIAELINKLDKEDVKKIKNLLETE